MGKIAVLGAGISGLVAARDLTSLGHSVLVFEKSRSFSGRCVTRKWQGHVVDHGAQYFTISSPGFRQEIDQLPQDSIQAIRGDVINEQGQAVPASGGSRYFFRTGNNRLGKWLAEGLDVRLENEIVHIQANGSGWEINQQCFDVVLLTLPWPQTATLLDLDADAPVFLPCLTVFFEWEGLPSGLAQKRYALSLRDPSEPLAWSACENFKSGRIVGNKTVFVVQASEAFSKAWIEAPPEQYSQLILERLKEQWQLAGNPAAVFCHRWRYARKASACPIPKLPRGIFIAGDSRVDSKIEQVWMDGKRAAQEISNTFRAL